MKLKKFCTASCLVKMFMTKWKLSATQQSSVLYACACVCL